MHLIERMSSGFILLTALMTDMTLSLGPYSSPSGPPKPAFGCRKDNKDKE